jgi:hypothetical protein
VPVTTDSDSDPGPALALLRLAMIVRVTSHEPQFRVRSESDSGAESRVRPGVFDVGNARAADLPVTVCVRAVTVD